MDSYSKGHNLWPLIYAAELVAQVIELRRNNEYQRRSCYLVGLRRLYRPYR